MSLVRIRRLFTGYNVLLVVAGGLVIVASLSLLSPSLDDFQGGRDVEVQTHIVCILGSVSVVIGILGVSGAHKMKRVVLTVHLVCTLSGSVLMLRAGVAAAVARPKLEALMEDRWRSFLPLDQASGDIQHQAEALQTSLHCCGLFSHDDWKENTPPSCLCNPEEEVEDTCQTVSYSNILQNLFWQKKSVFRQHCFPLFMVSVIKHANVTLAVVFSLFVLAFLGSVLSAVMICQMNTSNKPNTPLPAPAVFIDPPPAYEQLHNLAE